MPGLSRDHAPFGPVHSTAIVSPLQGNSYKRSEIGVARYLVSMILCVCIDTVDKRDLICECLDERVHDPHGIRDVELLVD